MASSASDKTAKPKHDLLPEELHGLHAWWQRHGTRIAILLTLVAVLAAGLTLFRRQRRQTIETAAAQFGQARTLAQLEDLVGAYGKTPPGVSARLKLAKQYFDSARYPMALETYETFMAEHPDHPLVAVARVGAAHTLEAMRRPAEALQVFDAFVQDNPEHFLRPQAVLGQARCLAQLERRDEARDRLERIILDNPGTVWAFAAEALKPGLERLAQQTGPTMFQRMTQDPPRTTESDAALPPVMPDGQPEGLELPESAQPAQGPEMLPVMPEADATP